MLKENLEKTDPLLELWTNNQVEVVRHRNIRRLSIPNLAAEVSEAFNINKGFVRTFVGLSYQPAHIIKAYLGLERDLITSPVKYFLLIVGLALYAANATGYFQNLIDFDEAIKIEGNVEDGEGNEKKIEGEKVMQAFKDAYNNYFIQYQNVWSIITIVTNALFSFLFFRKSGFNFIEHTVINTYVFVHSYVVFFITLFLPGNPGVWATVYTLAYFAYAIWVYHSLFNGKWSRKFIKAILSLALSIFTYFMIIMGGIVYVVVNTVNG